MRKNGSKWGKTEVSKEEKDIKEVNKTTISSNPKN